MDLEKLRAETITMVKGLTDEEVSKLAAFIDELKALKCRLFPLVENKKA